MIKGRSSSSGSLFSKPSKELLCRRARNGIAARQEAAFMEEWRESRSISMQPRKEELPSARDRLEAVRARFLARCDAT